MDTYLRDPTFIMGFLTGMVATILAAIVAGRLGALWNRLRQPFKPTLVPGRLPTERGPSPVQQFFSWLGSVIVVILVLAIIGVLVWMLAGGASS